MNLGQTSFFQLLFTEEVFFDAVNSTEDVSRLSSDDDPGQPTLPLPGYG